jgi:DNA-binding GntR family transcriptional regulator
MLVGSVAERSPAAIAEILREDICAGRFEDGSPLVQDDLAHRLGVSKIPIREALRLLEAEGVVVFLPNRGAIIHRMSPDEAREITEMRLSLEPAVLRRAVPHFDRQHARHAMRILEDLEDVSTPAKQSALNWQFHAALYFPANRPRQIAVVRGLHVQIDRYMRLILAGLKHQRRSQAEHGALLDACIARRSAQAARILEAHIETAAQMLLACLRERDDASRARSPGPRSRSR